MDMVELETFNLNETYKEAVLYFVNNKNAHIMETASRFNIDRSNFRLKLKEIGLYEDRKKKYACNEHFFDTIDSDEKAYFLGFLLADGCVKNENILSIGLKHEDRYLLESFKNLLESTYPITDEIKISNFSPNGTEASYFRIRSKALCSKLKEYGIIPRKTFAAQFNPNNLISPQFINGYLRGIFDGDGWVSIYESGKEIGFCGTEAVCSGISSTLLSYLNVKSTCKPYSSIYRLRVSNTHDITQIYNFMYQNASIYLKRKKDKMFQIADLNEPIK